MEVASGGVYWVVGNQTVASLGDLGSSGGKVMCSSASTATVTLAPPAGTTTFSGVVQNYTATSGTLALVIAGTGTEVLAGSNTYSGGTTIQSGTLQLGDGVSKNGSVAGNIADNARLVFADPNAETYSGTIGGSGSLTKTAAGALILAGSNLFSGGTEIDAGTLVAANGTNGSATGSGVVSLRGGILASAISGGSIAGDVIVNSAASEIAPGGVGSIGRLVIGDLTTASNLTTLDFDLTTPDGSGDLLVVTNGLSLAPDTAIAFGTNPTAVGDYRLIGGNFGTPVLGNFALPPAPAGESYSLSTTVEPGYIDLVVSAAVPEPSTFALLGVAALGLLGCVWRQKRAL